MQSFVVHVYAVIRRRFLEITAVDHKAAIEVALASPEFATWLATHEEHHNPVAADTVGEDAEEIAGYLVDVVGDEEYTQTKFFYSNASEYVQLIQQLAEWRKSETPDMVAFDKLLAEAQEKISNVF